MTATALANTENTTIHRYIPWLIVGVAILHLPSLFNPFFIDDYVYLDAAHNASWSSAWTMLNSPTMNQDASGVWWTPYGDLPFYRPLAIFTFVAEYNVWGMNPFGYHLTNLILHLLCTWLVWRLALRLCTSPQAAFVATAAFSIHPVHSEAVLWISGRFDLLVCAAMVVAIMTYMDWRQSGKLAPLIISVISFVVGLGFKETAIILPAVLFMMEVCFPPRGTRRWDLRAFAIVCFVYGLIAGLYLVQRFSIFGGLGSLPPPYGVDIHSPDAASVIVWNLAQYLIDFVFFVQVDAIYLAAFWEANAWMLTALSVLAAGFIVAMIVLSWSRASLWLGLIIAVLFTAPALMAMPGERNVYLSSVGFALMLGSLFASLRARQSQTTGRRESVVVWTRRVAVLFCIIVVGEHGLMWRVANGAERVYADLMTHIPDPPPNARIFITNQCPLTAVGFTQGVRLRYGRPDLTACALTLSPHLKNLSTDTTNVIDADTVRIDRDGAPMFRSFIERFLLFSGTPDQITEAATRVGLTLHDDPESLSGAQQLTLTLPVTIDDEAVYFFNWNNSHVRSLIDLMWRADWPRLEPYQPNPPAGNAVATIPDPE